MWLKGFDESQRGAVGVFYEPQRGEVGRYLLSLLGGGYHWQIFCDTQTGVFGWFWPTQYSPHFVAYEYVFYDENSDTFYP